MRYDGKDDRKKAHDIAQHIDDKNGLLIHAYLHRKEVIFGTQNIGIARWEKQCHIIRWKKNGKKL
jgi:hypothetical protein